MEMNRGESVALLVADLLHGMETDGPSASPVIQSLWDDLLGLLAVAYDLRGRVPDQHTVHRVRNRLLCAGAAAIPDMREEDYGFAIGLLVWLIRDRGLPYDPTLSVRQPTMAHFDAHRVAVQFEHLQRRGGPSLEIRD